MTFDCHMLYPLHTAILDNSQVFGGVPCIAQLCDFSKWFFSPVLGRYPFGNCGNLGTCVKGRLSLL